MQSHSQSQNDTFEISRFQIISKIGDGGFGVVYRVKDLKTGIYYASKVAKQMIDEETKDSQETLLLFREINLMSILDHPSILKFIGYYPTNFEDEPNPTIITELASNGSLQDIINLEISGLSPDGWTDTTKLINIYGIASGMSYLHQHNILHRDLKTENVLVDDYLHPKISDFGLSKITDFLSISMNFQSQKGMKGTPMYLAPEILAEETYSKKGDVYAFAFIVLIITTGEVPFKGFSIYQLLKKVLIEGYRPAIKEYVPKAYRELIERCWSHEPSERPSFDEIVDELKNNNEFITDLIDQNEFYDYVEFIDKYQATFNFSKKHLRFDDFIKGRGKGSEPKTFSLRQFNDDDSTYSISRSQLKDQKVTTENDKTPIIVKEAVKNDTVKINESSSQKVIENESSSQKVIENESSSQKVIENESSSQKIIENDKNKQMRAKNKQCVFNSLEYQNLPENCRKLVDESENDSEKQFIVGQSLIEGTNEFQQNVSLGLQYIKSSVKQNYIESIIYYIRMLIKGDIITQDFEKADKYLSQIESTNDPRIFTLKGRICYKKNKYNEAVKYFEEGSKLGDNESMYEYGKMLFLGKVKKDNQESFKYFIMSKDKGNLKSEIFIAEFDNFNKSKEFKELPPETQIIFIENNIKNIIENKDQQLILSPRKTERLFFNKSLKSPNFYKLMNSYNDIIIEIDYPSASFDLIIDLVIKIKAKINNNIKIGIVFTSFVNDVNEICFSSNISFHKIDTSIHIIPSNAFERYKDLLTNIIIPFSVNSIKKEAFMNCSSLKEVFIPSSVTSLGSSSFFGCSSLTRINIPSSINIIKNSTFNRCSSLKSISIPLSVTKIDSFAFSCCISLEKVDMNQSLTVISDHAFRECVNLVNLTIPSSVKLIGISAFYKCKLQKVNIPPSVTSIEYGTFCECQFLKEVTIPPSVTIISDKSFYKCESLIDITIPSSVVSIGKESFASCFLREIEIPSSITSIGERAFYCCRSLKKIIIPSSITVIKKELFKDCLGLNEVEIPSSVTLIEANSFFNSSLINVIIPSSVTSIGISSFGYCLLKEITIPSSVISIGCEAFIGCKSLKKVTILSSITKIQCSCFRYCESLNEINIPSTLTSIEDDAFSDCKSLEMFSCPDSLTLIGQRAFFGCSSLKQILFSSSLTTIHYNAFRNCASLTQIKIPSNVKMIQDNAFEGCSSLTKALVPPSIRYRFPDNVEVIKSY